MTELEERVSRLTARVESYDGGDRPMSPPVALLRELISAEEQLREERIKARVAATGEVA